MVTGISEEMTGSQVKELIRCLVEGDKGVMKPFNLSTLPVVSGMAIEVSKSDEGYILKGVKAGGKAVADDALFEIQEVRRRDAWVEYMKQGGQIAEPEDYITVK